jgi:MFS family permease
MSRSAANDLASGADPLRYAALVSYVILGVSNAISWITYSPIVDQVKPFFAVTAGEVDMLSSIYMFTYVSTVFISCKAYESLGLRQCLLFVCATNLAGSALKIIAVYAWRNVAVLFVSQFLNAVAQVFLIATPPLISAVWFPAAERTMATTIMSLSATVGVALGMVLPTWFVGPSCQGRDDFGKLFLLQLAIAAAPVVLYVFVVPSSPRNHSAKLSRLAPALPTGAVASESEAAPLVAEHSEPRWGMFSTVRDVLLLVRGNRAFCLLLLAGSIELGLCWAVATVLAQLLKPFGISEGQTGWIGFGNQIAGTVAAPMAAVAVERYRNYRLPLILAALLFTCLCAAMVAGLRLIHGAEGVLWLCRALWIAGGCGQNMLIPIMFEFGVELTFPVTETTTSSAIMWGGSTLSLVFIAVFGAILGNDPSQREPQVVLVIVTALSLVSVLLFFMIVPVHKRAQHEAEARMQVQSGE